jgi:hypothetical protein
LGRVGIVPTFRENPWQEVSCTSAVSPQLLEIKYLLADSSMLKVLNENDISSLTYRQTSSTRTFCNRSAEGRSPFAGGQQGVEKGLVNSLCEYYLDGEYSFCYASHGCSANEFPAGIYPYCEPFYICLC